MAQISLTTGRIFILALIIVCASILMYFRIISEQMGTALYFAIMGYAFGRFVNGADNRLH